MTPLHSKYLFHTDGMAKLRDPYTPIPESLDAVCHTIIVPACGEVVSPDDQPTMTFHMDEDEVVLSIIRKIIAEYGMEPVKTS